MAAAKCRYRDADYPNTEYIHWDPGKCDERCRPFSLCYSGVIGKFSVAYRLRELDKWNAEDVRFSPLVWRKLAFCPPLRGDFDGVALASLSSLRLQLSLSVLPYHFRTMNSSNDDAALQVLTDTTALQDYLRSANLSNVVKFMQLCRTTPHRTDDQIG